MSDPIPTMATPPSIDLDRLRAALRLVLEPVRADQAAQRIDQATDPIAALAELAGDLSRDRLLGRLNRRFDHSAIPESVSPRAAVILLAHVGLGVDGERIEDGFGIDDCELGVDLLNARAQYSGCPDLACREPAWRIGRYRDSALPPDDRVLLLSHLQACEGCRDALEAAQRADTTLLMAVEREMVTLPEWAATTRVRHGGTHLGSVAIVGGVIGLVVAVLAAVSVISGLFSAEDEPVPLFSGEYRAGERFDGWLLQVSPVGFLEAVDLATGFKRGLDSGDASGGFVPVYHVSDSHIATWRPSDGQRDDALTIGPIGEQIQHRLTWNRQYEFWYVSGWLDDDTLLIVKSPMHIPGETEQQYLERQTRESRLIAFDAVTGAESTLMTGSVAAAYPSPDGTMLAVYQPFDWRWPGYTIELRPTDGRSVGESIDTIEHRATLNGVWLADSSAYVAPIIADEMVRPETNRQHRTLSDHGVEQIDLERIGIDGSRSTLVAATIPDAIVPVSSSPDGRTIVYEVRTDRGGDHPPLVPAYDWSSYRLDVAGGEPELLAAGATPQRVFRPVWSPDGQSLALPVGRAFPLATDSRLDAAVGSNATTLLIFGADWQPGDDPVAFYSAGRDLYGWLPSDAFDARPGETAAGGRSLAAVVPEGGAFEQLAIDGAASDPQGTYVLVEDRQSNAPFAWSVDAQRPRRLSDSTSTHSWFNNGTATIAVASDQDGRPGSRIVLSVAEITRSPAYLDHRYYDPAELGDARDHRYALPLVSPGGGTIAFFVIDDRRGEITLWIDDAERPASVVGSWSFPVEAGVEPAIVAAWVAADTLLFAIPDGWQDGQPAVSSLSRLVIAENGNHRIAPLVALDAARGATGVEFVEFAVSRDGSELAYRLRHVDPDGATEDTLHVASSSDLNRAIELDRGGRGDGLQWTADGEHIIAGIRGRVARYAADGRSREYLSPRGVSASNAILVDGQLWFNGVDDRGARIWMIELE